MPRCPSPLIQRHSSIGRRQPTASAENWRAQRAAADLRGACATGRLALRWTTSALYFREVSRPEIDFMAAHRRLCRLHVEAFGPTTPAAFAWWSGLSAKDAREVWRQLELLEVDLDRHRAWILPEAEQTVRNAPEPTGIRFLPAPDLRLLGQDRHRLFVGPGGSSTLSGGSSSG
ncbi:DNA glycosylase AlkZ-like family protein [Kribbella sp. NPDC051620]|uniref:DNA glycosylase AlkZ-like family protein n=1 Tax=Kribbella sp. NPDC051620 TaxID=3364120 RepID=UPI00379F0C3A